MPNFDELSETECPFFWNVDKLYVEQNLTEKMLSNLNDPTEDSSPFQNFVYLVTAVYDAAVIREDTLEARKILLQYDHVYDKLVEDDMMKEYILAFKHILFSMSAYLSRCAKKEDLYHEVLREIPNSNEFDDANKAGLYGTKAAVLLEFGPFEPTIAACDLSKKAVELDGEQGEWHFLYGKGLHRHRRIEKKNSLSSRQEVESLTDEMKHLEMSVDLCPTPSKMVFLAESYVDAVSMIYRENKRVPSKSDNKHAIFYKMGNRAVELYSNAATNFGKSWYILLRCGMGFMKLEMPFKDVDAAKKYLEEAYKLKPESGFICHQLSLVYSRLKHLDRSFELAKKAADLGIVSAVLDEIRLGKSLFTNFDVLHSLNRNYEKYHAHGRSILSLNQGMFYFFRRNWDACLRSFIESFELCDKKLLPHLRSHAPYVSPKRGWLRPFSAIIFIHEVLKEMNNRGLPVNDDLISKLHCILRENYSEALKDKKTMPAVTETLRVVFD